jgi:signal transduction histidine kinase
MNAAEAAFLVGVVGSSLASAAIGVMALRRARKLAAGPWLGLMALGQAVWSGLYAGEVVASTMAGKIVWDKLEWGGSVLAIGGSWAFGLSFAGGRARALRRGGVVNAVIAVAFLALVATDPWHGLGYRACRMVAEPFPALIYDFGPAVLAGVLWMYALATWAMIALVRATWSTHPSYRRQIGWVVLGMAVPYAGGWFTLTGATWDISPFTFVVSDAILAFALFRHGLLATLPIARAVVLEHIGDGVVVADPAGYVVDVNPAADRLLGGLRVGSTLAGLASRLGVALPGEAGEVDWRLASGDEVRHLRVTATPIPVRRGQPAGRALVVRDQTAMRRAQAEVERAASTLARLNHDLACANRELESLNVSLSHELQAPLRHIRSFTAILVEEAGASLAPEARRLVDRIHHASDRMAALVAGMLRLAQIARLPLTREPVALDRIARDVARRLEAAAPDAGRELRIADGLDATADHALAVHLVHELLDNAFKFTRGRPAVIEVGREGTRWFVRDNGVGFDPRAARELWMPFRRVHAEDAAPTGAGLGLAVVKQIVDRHGGEVAARSAPGEGTTIYFTLEPAAG